MRDDGDGTITFSLARRRSKNRVNARLSRERKRLVLDTLQQQHWQLHQENLRVKDENDKIREAISSIKKAWLHQEREKASPQPSRPANLIAGLLLDSFPMQGLQQQWPQHQCGKAIVELLAQHLAMQGGCPNGGSP
jgi:hypothetical protein